MEGNEGIKKRKTFTSTAVKRRYNSKVYSRIYADLPKELVANFKAAAKVNGATIAEVLRGALTQYVKKTQKTGEKAGKNLDILA